MNERDTTKKAGSIKTCALLVSFHLTISSYKKNKIFHLEGLFSVHNSSKLVAPARTEPPLIPRHNTLSEENTWHHNTAAAIDAASRMPAHKISMTRSGQKTAFCPALALKRNTIHALILLTPGRSKWISMRHSELQRHCKEKHVGANATRSVKRCDY